MPREREREGEKEFYTEHKLHCTKWTRQGRMSSSPRVPVVRDEKHGVKEHFSVAYTYSERKKDGKKAFKATTKTRTGNF